MNFKHLGTLIILVLITVNLCLSVEPVAYKDNDTGLVFPMKLGGVDYTKVDTFDDPRMGYSVNYADENNLKASIYVYTGLHTNIPDGCDSSIIKEEIVSLQTMFSQADAAGIYFNTSVGEPFVRPESGSLRFQCITTKMERQVSETEFEKMLSESWVTGSANRMIKVRLTYPKSYRVVGEMVSESLMKDLITVLTTRRQDAPSPLTKGVLAAIQSFKRDPLSPQAKQAAQEITMFTIQSDDVLVTLTSDLIPIPESDDYPYTSQLMTAFIAGNIEPQLSGGAIHTDHSYEGVVQVLATYEQLLAKDKKAINPVCDELILLRDAGTLKAHVEKIQAAAKLDEEATKKEAGETEQIDK